MMNEAALLAARKGKDVIEMSDMEESIDKVIAGPERKNVIISDKEKKVVAYHESGHALVARFLPNTDPVHKISIIPRGGAALGYTLQLPTEDRYLISKQELMTRLAVLLGGRVAEEIVFEDITTGAHDDLQKATEIAREMVCEYGMSDTLGPLTLGRRHKEVFLGKDIAEDRNYSEEVAFTIDKEVRSIIDSAYEQARKLIIDNRDKLDKLTAILLEKEVLEREEIDKILDINGNEIPEFSSEEDKNKQAAAEQLLSDFPSNQEGRINTK
jgi:cell division protease FtsH